MTKCCSDSIHGVVSMKSKGVTRKANYQQRIPYRNTRRLTYLSSSYKLGRGAKRYKLSNHLGNVLTVISDKKTAICTGNTFNYFAAERISATDYSPFGTPLAAKFNYFFKNKAE